MKINEFLKLLEERQLVSAKILEQVRAKIAKGDRKITSKSLLKYLVKKELITRTQAKQLLETTLTVTAAAESSILGMQALTPEKPVKKKKKPDPASTAEEIPTLSPIDSAVPAAGGGFPEQAHTETEASLAEASREEATDQRGKSKGRTSKKDKKDKKKRGAKKNEFDTPLLLFGGGGLIALILAGVIIFFLLTREDADQVLKEASDYFEGQSYTQAIKQYEKFVEKFPSHPEHSAATVKLGLARIWKATDSTSKYSNALQTTQEVLDAIEDEEKFVDAQKDLSELLPKIADGLATEAEQESDPNRIATLVKETNQALALCNNTKFIPTNFRDDVSLNQIKETLDRVEREQEQRGKLKVALDEIQQAIEDKDTAKAYAIHKQLLKDYPGLLGDKALAEKVRAISAAEQSVVEYVEESQAAETEDPTTPLLAELALAARKGPASGVPGVVGVRVAGTVYAIDTDTGKLLWREHAGRGGNLPVVVYGDGDFLIVDSDRHELMKRNAADGSLVWRLQFESPIVPPVVVGERLLVTEQMGKIHLVEGETGLRNGYVSFDQKIPVAPAVNKKKTHAYVLGEHSSLFTLRLDDFSCLGAHFVGHQRGSVVVPPVTALSKVAMVENAGRDTARLHIFATDNEGVVATEDTTKRLEGLVNTPVLVEGRRLVAFTSRGQISVYEVGSGSGKEALTKLAERDAQSGRSVARFGLLLDGFVWSAGKRLSKFSVLPTGKRLPPKDTDLDYRGDTFDYPLQSIGGLVVHLRHAKRQAGSIVAAMEAKTGKALWETELGVPLAGSPVVDVSGPTISAVTASGSAYVLDRDAMKSGVQDQAAKLPSSAPPSPLTGSVDLGSGRMALGTPGENALLHFSSDGALNEVQLPKPLACPLVTWNNAFVAPTSVGQVYLFDADSGKQLGSPFQPELSSPAGFRWLKPAVYGTGSESTLVISDGNKSIYLVRRSDTPRPNLEAEKEALVSGQPLTTQLAIAGNTVFAGNQGGQLSRYSLPDLAPLEPLDVGGSVTWGPFRVGNQIVLCTGIGEMVSVGADGQILWPESPNYGVPVGAPLAVDGGIIVTWNDGSVSRIDLADGSQGEVIALSQPAATGPVTFRNHLLLAAPDGTLLILKQP